MKFKFKTHNEALLAIVSAGFYAYTNGVGTQKQKIVPMRTKELSALELSAEGYLDSEVFNKDKKHPFTKVWTDHLPEKRGGIGYLTPEGEIVVYKSSGLGRGRRPYRKNAKDFLKTSLALLQYYNLFN